MIYYIFRPTSCMPVSWFLLWPFLTFVKIIIPPFFILHLGSTLFDPEWFSSAQLGSIWLNSAQPSAQLGSSQLTSPQIGSIWLSLAQLSSTWHSLNRFTLLTAQFIKSSDASLQYEWNSDFFKSETSDVCEFYCKMHFGDLWKFRCQ